MKKVVVVFGLSGTGKSFVSRILHEEFGYVWIRSDEIRKELAGLKPSEHAPAPYGQGIYSPQMTEKVYSEMVRRAREELKKGSKVVLDATFLKKWQRDLVRKDLPDPLFLRTWCDDETAIKRIRRRRDISDADESVYIKQKLEEEKPQDEGDVIEINTSLPAKEIKDLLEDLLR